MTILTQLIVYLLFCLMYRTRQENQLFILKSLQTLKISKYRITISEKIKNHEKRYRWFLFWPFIDLYELYEDWQKNRNRNSKS